MRDLQKYRTKHAVIAGLGIVSNIDNNQQEVLISLREGRSGIIFSQKLKDSGVRSHIWGNVKLDTTGLIDRRVVHFISNTSIYVFLSTEQTIADASLPPGAYQNNPRTGLIASFGSGSPRFQVLGADAMRGPRGLKMAGPYVVIKAMAFGASTCLATSFKTHGANYSISSACVTSTHCIGGAVEQIQLGKQGIVFADGDEEPRRGIVCEFDAMGALSVKYNDTPEKAPRAYDAHRDGFVTVGGGGMVVVEKLEHALAHGARIYTEIVGYGATSDDADMVVPSGEGAVRCMKMTIYDVDVPIDYLNPHGTSTPVGSMRELAAIRKVLGNKSPTISTIRAMTGHSLGATGVREVIHSLLMLEHGFITPDVNIEELDEQAVGLNVVIETTDRELTTVMSNSFSFGSANATLVTRKLKD